MAIQTVDGSIDDGTGQMTWAIDYDDANGNQVTKVTYNNTTQTAWVFTIQSGGKPPLKTTIRPGRSGTITNAAQLAGYVGDPLLIEFGTT